jgi:hypothetical protein
MIPRTPARRSVWQVPHVWAKTSRTGSPFAVLLGAERRRRGRRRGRRVLEAALALIAALHQADRRSAADRDDEHDRERVAPQTRPELRHGRSVARAPS